MTKLVQNDITSLTNEQSALAALNANYQALETFSDSVLSRDGTSPNPMLADLDMNSHKILNIGDPLDMNHSSIIGLDDGVLPDEPATVNQLNNAILSGGGATANASYVVLSNTPLLTAERALAVGTGLTLTDGGANGSITVGLDGDLSAVAGLSTTGLVTRTATDTMTTRTLAAPAAGITITNPAGLAGNPTFALANDLNAVEGLASNGMAARTATDTWTTRTITGTANEITLANGDGVSANPTVSIPSAVTFTGKTVTGGTYSGPVVTGTLDIQQNIQWSGDLTPASFSTDQNDYNPGSLSTASTLRLNPTASVNLTGLAGGTDGRIIILHNINAAQSLTLKDESASSTAANRFALTADVSMSPDGVAFLQYDSTSQRWRAVSGGGGGGGGAPTTSQYVVIALDGSLSAERVLAVSGLATLTDGGANANATIGVPAATAADQETSTSTTVAVVPGVQHRHPSAVKAWARWNAAVSVAANYNAPTVTDNGTGDWTVNFTTAFSSANYGISGAPGQVATSTTTGLTIGANPAAGSCRIFIVAGNINQDPAIDVVCASFFGDQ